jgi:hypothetical protein
VYVGENTVADDDMLVPPDIRVSFFKQTEAQRYLSKRLYPYGICQIIVFVLYKIADRTVQRIFVGYRQQ